MKFCMKTLLLSLLASSLCAIVRAQTPAGDAQPWPAPVPCRIHDGPNPDLFIMTLGRVETPLADGVFDPVQDRVVLKNGAVKEHYYRDILGVKQYQPLDKSRFSLPPSGWCTWYYYYNRINAAEVERNAQWIADNLKDFGANYVQIDDGWQGSGGRDGGRDWTIVNPQRFPGGMGSLAARIKSLGLTPGLWLAPHGQSNPGVVSNSPNVFLLRTNGATASDTWEGRFLVDPTTPESLSYLKNMFTTFAGWGYEYFKIDGQPIVVDEYRDKKQFEKNPSDDAVGLYRNTLQSIRSAIGPDRYLLGCWGIPLEGAGIMNGSRTGGDIVLGWGGFQVALRPTMQFYYLHNIVWYSDPDVLVVRSPLTLDQARVWATLEGLTGQALMSSDRLMDLSEDRVELMRRVYPATDIRPLDLFPSERDKRIWDLKVNHLGRRYDVVGVFNFGADKTRQTRLNWRELGLPDNQPVHVFDFWNHEYLGAWQEGIVVDAAPTSCRVLTLLLATDRIELISTSRHITQGWVDLSALVRDEAHNAFHGTSRLVKNDPYELRFVFPRGTNYVIERATAHIGSVNLPVKIFNHQGWATAQIASPRTTDVTWEVQFAPADFYHFPPSEPAGLSAEWVGLDGINLKWREQYYLNAGYQVYLDGRLLGYTPSAAFPIRGLDANSNYTAQVKTIAEDGRESSRQAQVKFTLASLIPAELSLTQMEPLRATGRWRGFEADEMMSPAAFSVGSNRFDQAIASFAGSEIEFDLKGIYNQFTALVGLDAASGDTATVEFIVLGDGQELWRSGELKKSDAPKPVELKITGVHKLLLRTASTAGLRRNRAQAGWANPKVSRQPPKENG